MANVSRVRTLLNSLVDEIWWEERLSPYNHNPHFPYFVTHFTDSMPICSAGVAIVTLRVFFFFFTKATTL